MPHSKPDWILSKSLDFMEGMLFVSENLLKQIEKTLIDSGINMHKNDTGYWRGRVKSYEGVIKVIENSIDTIKNDIELKKNPPSGN